MNAGAAPLPFAQLRMSSEYVLAWWDRSVPGTTVGTLFILLAECALLARLCKAGAIDVAVDAQSHGIKDVRADGWRRLDPGECSDAALSVLAELDNVDTLYACDGDAGFQSLAAHLAPTHMAWPVPELAGRYDTTQQVQTLWREVGQPARLSFRPGFRNWADAALGQRFGAAPRVGLHLKNIPSQGDGGASLANETAWREFLSTAADRYTIGFVLLGDDPAAESIATLPNVALARDMGADSFGKHMVLLGQCSGFMGMMSALSNLALFSDMPYAIFKHPDHHRTAMLSEIGDADHYPFATAQQKVFRVEETAALLLSAFERMPFVKGRLQ